MPYGAEKTGEGIGKREKRKETRGGRCGKKRKGKKKKVRCTKRVKEEIRIAMRHRRKKKLEEGGAIKGKEENGAAQRKK